MSRIASALSVPVIADSLVVSAARLACFAAGPAVFLLSFRAVARLASTPGEVLLGVLGGTSLALLLVILGLLLPRATTR
jgi:hypothetical protein